MKTAAIIIFFVCLLTNLFFDYKGNKLARAISKPFILLSVALNAIALDVKNPFVYIALGFGMIGDVLMCFDAKKKWVIIPGTICYVLNHSFFIAGLVYSLEMEIPLVIILVYAMIFILFAFFMKKPLEKPLGKLAPFASAYAGLLAIEFLFAIFFFMITARYNYLISYVPFIGTVLYICADLFLVRTSFIRHKKSEEMITTSTYAFAQLLLSIGIGLY